MFAACVHPEGQTSGTVGATTAYTPAFTLGTHSKPAAHFTGALPPLPPELLLELDELEADELEPDVLVELDDDDDDDGDSVAPPAPPELS